MDNTELEVGDLMLAKVWREERGNHLFPSSSSFEWFLRQNRDALIELGCYIPRAGAAGSLVTMDIERVIPRILRASVRQKNGV